MVETAIWCWRKSGESYSEAMIDVSTPVVVVRCSRHGGLGITRTLGRMGVPVYHVDRCKSAPAFHSRYSGGRFVWDVEKSPPLDSVAFLGEVAAAIGRRAILIPTSDATAMLVAEHAEALGKWFDFPVMPSTLVRALCSKREMFLLAQKYGVATPETRFPQSRDELLAYSKCAKFPVMAKGIFGVELERKAGKRMFLVHNPQQLLDLYEAHEDWFRPNFILQEFIPGSTACWIANAYFDSSSDCLVEFTGRKVRQYPADGGLASLGECRHNETIARITRDFAKACGYRGALDIDFHYDQRDGQYKILDINPRVGATFRLFVGADGMDVVRAMYLDLTGQAVAPTRAPDGRKWLVEDCDFLSSLSSLRQGKITLRDWLRSFRGVKEIGVFAIDDPVPALWMAVRHLRRVWESYQASRLAMLTRKRGLDRSVSSIS
jgi:D-aspartate ligase